MMMRQLSLQQEQALSTFKCCTEEMHSLDELTFSTGTLRDHVRLVRSNTTLGNALSAYGISDE